MKTNVQNTTNNTGEYFKYWVNLAVVECLNIGKRASKTMQLGFYEVGPNNADSNLERNHKSIIGLLNILHILDVFYSFGYVRDESKMLDKVKKIQNYAHYSSELGMLLSEVDIYFNFANILCYNRFIANP